ncbi:hypothetical protein [Schaalia suimastitidis]|uniref:hypothetical protein n=1 Tax=Schaalia suimastitidis TaxID=121163 RepID=UPI00041280CC|nr:hypothetical protein [Schaalia suimastitidis]
MTADNHHLAFLIEMLAGNSLPADIDIRTAPEGDLATIFRALMNQWDTRPLPPTFYEQQDAWLQTQAQRKGVVTIEETTPSPVDHRLRLWRGDITRLAVDAIVNAANQQMLGCFARDTTA